VIRAHLRAALIAENSQTLEFQMAFVCDSAKDAENARGAISKFVQSNPKLCVRKLNVVVVATVGNHTSSGKKVRRAVDAL
jgi:hypothetical protein